MSHTNDVAQANALIDRAEAALREGRAGEARAALEQALAEKPPPSIEAEASSMLGLALLMAGARHDALEPLERAVALDPAEAMFRYNLARGLEMNGRVEQALAAHREAVRLANGQPALVLALAQALARAGRFDEAAQRLGPLAAGPAAPPMVRRLMAKCLQGAGDLHAAIDAARPLLPDDPASADKPGRDDALLLARLYRGAMVYSEAEAIGRALIARDPGDGEAAALLAPIVLWTEGPEAARAIVERASACVPDSPELLALLIGFNDALSPRVLERAEAIARDEAVPAQLRAELLLALAQYHDRTGDPERAWELAGEGNRMTSQPEPRDWRALLATHLSLYRDIPPMQAKESGPAHFYLCGPPRSGQSLVQSILAAAPGVASAGERGALLGHLLWRAEDIGSMPAAQKTALYAELAAADRRGLERVLGRPELVVDKNPYNLVVAGSIARIHPRARFAAALRDPADVAVSIYLRGFSAVYDYATDLGRILDHLDFQLDALEAWRDAGLVIRPYDHAAMLGDPAGESRRLFDWLGLEWDEAYLTPENRTQPVPTFSAAQVRKPISKKISRGAAPYRKFLSPYEDKIAKIRERQAALIAQQKAG